MPIETLVFLSIVGSAAITLDNKQVFDRKDFNNLVADYGESGPKPFVDSIQCSSITPQVENSVAIKKAPGPFSASEGGDQGQWVFDPKIDQYFQLADDPMAYKVAERLALMHHLDPDWDGYGAQAPSKESVDEAADFLIRWCTRFAAPSPMVSSDGQVGLFWQADGVYIDLRFLGEGRVAYLAKGPDNETNYCTDISINETDGLLPLFSILEHHLMSPLPLSPSLA